MHKNDTPPTDPDKHVLGAVRTQDFRYRLASVKIDKMKAAQENRRSVVCGTNTLENVFSFLYLGTLFAADGQQIYDIKRRIALAMSRCDQLRHIFSSPRLSLQLKLRLYDDTVFSIFTYGCETWDLSVEVIRKINGVNIKMLSHITGRSAKEEARSNAHNELKPGTQNTASPISMAGSHPTHTFS